MADKVRGKCYICGNWKWHLFGMPREILDNSGGDKTRLACKRCQCLAIDTLGIIEAITTSPSAAFGFAVSCVRGMHGDKAADKLYQRKDAEIARMTGDKT